MVKRIVNYWTWRACLTNRKGDHGVVPIIFRQQKNIQYPRRSEYFSSKIFEIVEFQKQKSFLLLQLIYLQVYKCIVYLLLFLFQNLLLQHQHSIHLVLLMQTHYYRCVNLLQVHLQLSLYLLNI